MFRPASHGIAILGWSIVATDSPLCVGVWKGAPVNRGCQGQRGWGFHEAVVGVIGLRGKWRSGTVGGLGSDGKLVYLFHKIFFLYFKYFKYFKFQNKVENMHLLKRT